GDGYADVIIGQASGGSHVTVSSGKFGTPLASFDAYDAAFTSGARVGAADRDGDGLADILTAPGASGTEQRVRARKVSGLSVLTESEPYPGFGGGSFVGGG